MRLIGRRSTTLRAWRSFAFQCRKPASISSIAVRATSPAECPGWSAARTAASVGGSTRVSSRAASGHCSARSSLALTSATSSSSQRSARANSVASWTRSFQLGQRRIALLRRRIGGQQPNARVGTIRRCGSLCSLHALPFDHRMWDVTRPLLADAATPPSQPAGVRFPPRPPRLATGRARPRSSCRARRRRRPGARRCAGRRSESARRRSHRSGARSGHPERALGRGDGDPEKHGRQPVVVLVRTRVTKRGRRTSNQALRAQAAGRSQLPDAQSSASPLAASLTGCDHRGRVASRFVTRARRRR